MNMYDILKYKKIKTLRLSLISDNV